MSNYRDILVRLFFRLLVAVPIFIGGLMVGGLIALSAVLLGAIIVAGPIAHLFGEPLGNILYPARHSSRKAPMYGVPESRRARGLYEEAMVEYRKIMDEHPGEVKPYIGMIDTAVVNLKDPERASIIYNRGMASLQNENDRNALTNMYLGICSRISDKPEWLRKERERVLSLANVSVVDPGMPEYYVPRGMNKT